jgi:NAD(P)H-hydrate epimerase
MRSTDRWAIDQRGVPSIDLMERAGAGVAHAVERLDGGPAAVLCGKGNNGGDGLVAARLLREAGRPVTVICIAPPEELSGDAHVNLERLPGDPPVRLDGSSWGQRDLSGAPPPGAGALENAQVLVDALLGTGFKGEARGEVAVAIAAIEGHPAPVVSVDVPSGVDASTGVVSGPAVHAALTVTFHAPKPGLWINPGKEHAGVVETIDIGIPRGAPLAPSIGLIEPTVLELLPRRRPGSTKFSSGHVLVVGGSRGLTGAPRMAAHASMRAGAGYVTACVPGSLQALIAASATPELMTRGLPDSDGSFDTDGVGDVLDAAGRGALALALGPGLGRRERAGAFARAVAGGAEVPMVLDADGLNAHVGHLGDLAVRSTATVLTPHAGELGRLLSLESAAIDSERLRHARAAAVQAQSVVVLKGDDTLIAEPSGRVAVSPGGAPALATAGTGDVLTGVIAAALAQGLDAFAAAVAGVWLHVEAGREAARRLGGAEGVIATDVIAALPYARNVHARDRTPGGPPARDGEARGEGEQRR